MTLNYTKRLERLLAVAKYELNLEKLNEAIKVVGGISNLSIKTKISYQSIIDWRGRRKAPSLESCIKIENATDKKVTRKDLLPDYPWDETHADAIKDEKSQIAKNLLTAGIDIETIAKTTGLSIEELENIKS